MDFEISHGDEGVNAVLSGQLTFRESATFRTLLQQLGGGTSSLRIDLKGLDFIDSAGLGMLLVMREHCDGEVRLRVGGGQVSRLLQLARFSDFFHMESGE